MFRFPWGDMHSLNLGWFLQKFNELREDWATAEAGIDGALDAEIQRAEDALSDVFDARDAAAASATAAAGSASAANTSKTAAQNSATAAASSATLANQKATAAGLSEAAAAQSATAASNSASAAAGSATQAGQSATNAAGSATAAGNSASAAAGSATAAGNSATAAAGSATAAGDSATAAAASAAAAAQSASNVDSVQYILEALPSIWLKNKYGMFTNISFGQTNWKARLDGMRFLVDLTNAIDQSASTALRISGTPAFTRGVVHSAENETIPLKAGTYIFSCRTRSINSHFSTAYFTLRKTTNDVTIRVSSPVLIPLGVYTGSFEVLEDGNYELVLVLVSISATSPIVEFSVNIEPGSAQTLGSFGRIEGLELTDAELPDLKEKTETDATEEKTE